MFPSWYLNRMTVAHYYHLVRPSADQSRRSCEVSGGSVLPFGRKVGLGWRKPLHSPAKLRRDTTLKRPASMSLLPLLGQHSNRKLFVYPLIIDFHWTTHCQELLQSCHEDGQNRRRHHSYLSLTCILCPFAVK